MSAFNPPSLMPEGEEEQTNGTWLARRELRDGVVFSFGSVVDVSNCKDRGLNLFVFAARLRGLRAARGVQISLEESLLLAYAIAQSENKEIYNRE